MPKQSEPINMNLAESFYDLKADFQMGKDSRFHSRLRGVHASGSGADYHYRNERQWLHMLERARFYRRDDQIVGQGVRRLVANILQDGFNLDVSTGDDGINAELKSRWKEWSENADLCHSEQELTWNQIERMTLDAVITDGDVLHLPLKDGTLQPVEAHRLRTPSNTKLNVVHGVHLDERARRNQYWITKEDLGLNQALKLVSDIHKYDARDADGERQVFHIYDPVRFSQRRGVTAFAPISFTIGSNDDIQFSAMVKQQMGALITLLRERTAEWEPPAKKAQFGPETQVTEDGYTRNIEGMAAAMEVASAKGEKLSMFAANVPGPQFKEHTMLILTFIAINLDLPVHLLLLDPSETNFSGWRGAIDQARLRFRQIQNWLIGQLHSPVYRWKVRQWIEENAHLKAAAERSGIHIFRHTWNPPSWKYIEPLKDAAADQLQDSKLLNSKRRLQADRGRDWDEVSTEIVDDNASIIRKAIKMAMDINNEFTSANLDWREILRLPTADSVSASMELGAGKEKKEAA